ncbi:MAG: hypothetical protein IH985_05710, partial [Planctomycetes bacterium]|nr:hypothetical protein [Planctomycetota bacterium]
MLMRKVVSWLMASVGCAACSAQVCEPVWSDAFVGGGVQSSRDNVQALHVFDNGSITRLFVAGDWTMVFGGVVNGWVGAFDGDEWTPATAGLDDGVLAFTTFDDGTGTALYAGGGFTGAVRRWNGQSWEQLGTGITGYVQALAVFDDGTGSALWTGTHKWDGQQWTIINNPIAAESLAVLDEGSGNVLYAVDGGRVYRRAGGQWVEVSPRPGLISVFTLAVFDDGSGASLYAGGSFSGIYQGVQLDRVAKLENEQWIPVGTGLSRSVHDLAASQAHGVLVAVGFQRFMSVWNGTVWETVADNFNESVNTVTTGDLGEGERVFIGGRFDNKWNGAPPFERLAQWDGSALLPLGRGLNGFVGDFTRFKGVFPAMAFQEFDDGTGSAVYVGGSLTFADQILVNGIARWDGASWSSVGGGLGAASWVWDLEVVGERGTDVLYAAGLHEIGVNPLRFGIAKWDGAQWEEVVATSDEVMALLYVPTGPLQGLYASGRFSSIGGVAAVGVAKLDLSTGAWSALGAGLSGFVMDLALFDDGSGPAIYAGGSVVDLAKWNGSGWQSIVIGGSQNTFDLEVYDVGAGPQLFFAGSASGYYDASGVTILSETGNMERAVAGFDDGTGPAVYFGGFASSAPVPPWASRSCKEWTLRMLNAALGAVLVAVVFVAVPSEATGQGGCGSVCVPLAVLDPERTQVLPKAFRFTFTTEYGDFDRFVEGDDPVTNRGGNKAIIHETALFVDYGASRRLTVSVLLPYIRKIQQTRRFGERTADGLGDIAVFGRYELLLANLGR